MSDSKIKIYPKEQKVKKPYNINSNVSFTPIYLKQNNHIKSPKINTDLNTNLYTKKLTKVKKILFDNKSRTPKPKKRKIIDNSSHYKINSRNKDYLFFDSPLPEISLKRNKSTNLYKDNSSFYLNIPQQLEIIFSLKKKIVEQNKIIKNKIIEINNLKDMINISKVNEYKIENDILKEQLEKMKKIIENNNKLESKITVKSNREKEIENINKLKDDIENLSQKINDINDKYINNKKKKIFKNNILLEENKNLQIIESNKTINLKTERPISITLKGREIIKEFEHIFENNLHENFLKESSLKPHFENFQIENSQFEIDNLLNNNICNTIQNNINIEVLSKKQFFVNKNKNLKIQENNFGILNKNDFIFNNFIKKSFSFISQDEYNDIKKLLFLKYKALNIRIREIENLFDSNVNNISIIFFQICKLFKINNNSLIERFMLSLSKSKIGFSYDKLKENFIKIFQNKLALNYKFSNYKYIKEIIVKCKSYDYQNKGFIPYYYFNHIYNEINKREKIKYNEEEFCEFIFEMLLSKNDSKSLISLYNLNYLNLKNINIEEKNIINETIDKKEKGKDINNINNINKNYIQNSFDVHNEIPHEIKIENQNEINKEITNKFLNNVFDYAYNRYKKRKSSSYSSQSERQIKPKNIL